MIIISPITIVALTFAKYSVKLLFPECDPPDDSVRMLAAVCICVLAFINCWNVKVRQSRLQGINWRSAPHLTQFYLLHL